MQIQKKSLATSHLAYDEIFLYVNGLVIKMYKERKKAWNRQHQWLPWEYPSIEEHDLGPLWQQWQMFVAQMVQVTVSLEENKDSILYL